MAIAAVPAAGFAVFTGADNPADLVKATLVVVAALGMLGIGVLRLVRERTLLFPDRTFSAAVALFALALTASVVVSSSSTRALVGTYMRWTGAGPYLAYGVIGVVVARVARSTERRSTLARVVLWSAVILAVYALMQRAGIDPIPWQLPYGDSAPSALGNPNFASAFFGIPVPIAVFLVMGGSSRLMGVGALIVLLGGMWATGSWLGPFAALCGTVIGGVLYLLSDEERRRRILGAGVAAAFASGGLALAVLWLTEALPVPYAVGIRFYYFDAAIRMWSGAPLSGVGLGRYGDFFLRSRSPEGLDRFGTGAIADGPHSAGLGLLSEGGLLVVLPYLAVLGVIAWYAIRAARASDRRSERLLVAGVGGAWAGYVLQSVGNYDVPQLAVIGWVLGGMVVASAAPDIHRVSVSPAVSYIGATALGLVVLVGAVLVWRPLQADAAARDARVLESRGNVSGALEAARDAADIGYWDPRYLYMVGRLSYEAGDTEGGYRAFTEAADSSPHRWDVVISAAQISAETGRYEESVSWYRKALEIDPYALDARGEFGQALLLAGMNEEAARVLEDLTEENPDNTVWWQLLAEAYTRLGRQADADHALGRVEQLQGG